MALILLLAVPLVTGLGLLGAGRRVTPHTGRLVAGGVAGLTAVLAVVAVVSRPVVDRVWIPELGVHFALGVDGISAPLIVLTALIGVLVTVHAFAEQPQGGSPGVFLGALLLVVGGALATFAARDAILFFVAFEIVLIPMWVLITRFGDPHSATARREAGQRFILYTAFGSTLMLVGILVLVTATGTSSLPQLVERGAALDHGTQVLAAALLVTGLAVKVPVLPLHTWLPSAHTTAPTAGSVLLAAVLLKMGTYGLVRLPLATLPAGFATVAPFLAGVGAIGIVWGSLICLVERDLKRLIAYSSVAHMGFVVVGLASGTSTGLQAALMGNIAHGLISALLFVVVGGLKHRWGIVDLRVTRPALREVAPHLGFAMILGLAASLGLPGLAGFWAEFLTLLGSWEPAPDRSTGLFRAVVIVGAVGAALGAAYALRVARLVWVGDAVKNTDSGAAAAGGGADGAAGADSEAVAKPATPGTPLTPGAPATPDARGPELLVVAVLAALVIGLGLLPHAVLEVTGDAVRALVGGGQ